MYEIVSTDKPSAKPTERSCRQATHVSVDDSTYPSKTAMEISSNKGCVSIQSALHPIQNSLNQGSGAVDEQDWAVDIINDNLLGPKKSERDTNHPHEVYCLLNLFLDFAMVHYSKVLMTEVNLSPAQSRMN